MAAELGLDIDAIVSYCEQKAEEAKQVLEGIYAERRTTEKYWLKVKEEEQARRDRQRFCQWRDAWHTLQTDKQFQSAQAKVLERHGGAFIKLSDK